MIAKTLALTLRSIREDTRLLRTHLFRLFLLAIVLWFLFLTQWNDLGRGAPGLEFFQAITWLNFAFISLMGVTFFASAITEEKEEMTLGLLRMAGIGPLALLLGKMLPRLFGALLLVSVQYPFTLLAITLGGVTRGQVTAAYCTLLSYTLLLAGVALFWSVTCRLTRTAAFLSAVTIGTFLFIPWLALVMLRALAGGALGTWLEDALDKLATASPFYRIFDIMSTAFTGDGFGYQAQVNTAAALVLFVLSWLTFDWFNRDERSASPMRGIAFRSSSRLRKLGGGRVWGNALMWKDLQFIAGGPMMLLVKGGLYVLVAIALVFFVRWTNYRQTFDIEEYAGWNMSLALFMFLIEGALLASNVFRQEVKWKTLPSLVMLPGSMIHKAYAKVAGAMFGLLPACAWFVFGAICYPSLLFEALEELLDEPVFWFMAANYVLILHLAAFLSLIVKWMAFPLSIGIVFMTNFCCMVSMFELGRSNGDGPAVVMVFLAGFASIVLHIGIGERLKTLACR